MTLLEHLMTPNDRKVPTWLQKVAKNHSEAEITLFYARFSSMRAPLVGISNCQPDESQGVEPDVA